MFKSQWNPSITLLTQLKCPYQGVLIIGVGLYVRVLIIDLGDVFRNRLC